MALGEVGLCLGLALLPPIIHLIFVDHLFLIVMVITEVEIRLIPANFLHITIVN